jgi:hypothetical protein
MSKSESVLIIDPAQELKFRGEFGRNEKKGVCEKKWVLGEKEKFFHSRKKQQLRCRMWTGSDSIAIAISDERFPSTFEWCDSMKWVIKWKYVKFRKFTVSARIYESTFFSLPRCKRHQQHKFITIQSDKAQFNVYLILVISKKWDKI